MYLKNSKFESFKITFILFFLVIIFFSSWFVFYKYLRNLRDRVLMPLQMHAVNSKSKPANPSFFYGVNVDISQLLPDSKNYVVNSKGEDLIDIAEKLGINFFRITNSVGIDDKGTSIYTKQEWDTVLAKMQKNHIKALILIESPTIYQKNIPSSYLPFVREYVLNSDVLTNPDVYGVDLYNELAINDSNITQLKISANMIKTRYPQTNLTVGWWTVDTHQKNALGEEIYSWDDYAAGKQFEPIVDFYSLHMYGFDKAVFGKYPDPYLFTQNFIQEVENKLETTKPILIEEFGAANGETISDQNTIGSPQIQANTYQGVYQSLYDMHDKQIIGVAAFDFISRNKKPDAWAIIKNKGDYFFPAANIVQRYATNNHSATTK